MNSMGKRARSSQLAGVGRSHHSSNICNSSKRFWRSRYNAQNWLQINAHVRIKGHSAEVRRGRWKLPVTLAKHGDNTFHVVATRRGFVKNSTTAVVTRKLSAAEKAVARQEAAERRANRRALQSAESYLAMSGFSKQRLYEQLSSSAGEGFTQAQAQYAVDHVDTDWKREAVESARSYLEMSPMSRAELIEQLSSSAGEGFTYEQAVYAVNKAY